jgi:ornithine carbamoyltransferase
LTAIKRRAGAATKLHNVTSSSHVLHHRSTWSLDTLSGPELLALVEAAGRLKQAARAGIALAPLRGKQLALVGDSDPDGLLRDAATALGAKVSSLLFDAVRGVNGSSSRLLGKLYDAVDCAGAASPKDVERDAGIPVFNGLGGDRHPARALAALAAIHEASERPLQDLHVALVGDAASPCAQAIAKAAARIGFELRNVPSAEAAEGADFVLDIRDTARWTLTDRDGRVHDGEREDRRFVLEALLVSTLT